MARTLKFASAADHFPTAKQRYELPVSEIKTAGPLDSLGGKELIKLFAEFDAEVKRQDDLWAARAARKSYKPGNSKIPLFRPSYTFRVPMATDGAWAERFVAYLSKIGKASVSASSTFGFYDVKTEYRIPGFEPVSDRWQALGPGAFESIEYAVSRRRDSDIWYIEFRGDFTVYTPYGEVTVPVSGRTEVDHKPTAEEIPDLISEDVNASVDDYEAKHPEEFPGDSFGDEDDDSNDSGSESPVPALFDLPEGKLPPLVMDALPPWARTAWAKAGIKRDDVAVIESPRHDKAINGSVYVSRSKEALSGYVSGATPTYDKPLGVWFVSDVVRMDYLAALGTTAAAIANHIQRAAHEFAIVSGVGADVRVQTAIVTLDQEPDAKVRAKLVSKARKVLGAEAPEHADVLQVVISGDDVIGASAVRSLSDETRFWVRGEAAAESRIAELLGVVLTTHSGANLTGRVQPVSTDAMAILEAAGFKRSKVAGVEQWSNSESSSALPADLVPFDMLFEYIRLPDVLPRSEDEDEDTDLEVVIGREEIRGVESTYYTLTVSARSFDVEKLRSALALKLQRPSNMIQFGLGRSQFKVVGQ